MTRETVFSDYMQQYDSDEETEHNELMREIDGMKDEIRELSETLNSNERTVTCAVTGHKFREVRKVLVDYIPIPPVVENKRITRSTGEPLGAQCLRSDSDEFQLEFNDNTA
jgi:hypothetical protein